MTKINKDEFEFLDKDFPENPTREQVEHEIRRLQNLSKVYYNKQWAEKTIINSSYGALASKYFVGFNLKVASSVTEMGRNIVRYGATILNKYFDEYWPLDKELHQKLGLLGEPIKPQRQVLRYGDSVHEDSMIDIEYNEYIIDELNFSDFSLFFVMIDNKYKICTAANMLHNYNIDNDFVKKIEIVKQIDFLL